MRTHRSHPIRNYHPSINASLISSIIAHTTPHKRYKTTSFPAFNIHCPHINTTQQHTNNDTSIHTVETIVYSTMTRPPRVLQIAMVLLVAASMEDTSSSTFKTSTTTRGSSMMAVAQEQAAFPCGNPDDETTRVISNTDFTTIRPVLTDYKNNWLMPERTHWHMYAIPDGEMPRYSSEPEGLIKEPKVSGSILTFPVQEGILKDLGYSKGDKIDTAVNLFIPISRLRDIRIDSVNDYVEVIVASDEPQFDALVVNSSSAALLPTINIRSSGVDSVLYVNAPYSKVQYKGEGIDTTAIIRAGNQSSVHLSGVDQQVRIKSEYYLSSVLLEGVDIKVLIEGNDYGLIKLSGVDCEVKVNGETGCNGNVENSGVSNNCRATQDTVTVPTLACLSQSKVIKGSSSGDLSTGAIVGICLAILIVVAFYFVFCGYCRGAAPTTTASSTGQEKTGPAKSATTTEAAPAGSVLAEAQVIEVVVEDDPEQPALPSKNSGNNNNQGKGGAGPGVNRPTTSTGGATNRTMRSLQHGLF